MDQLFVVIGIVAVALVFDFINGFHDAANSIATVVSAITGAIVGVGATRRLSAVRWGVAGQILWAWILTIPAAAGIGAFTYYVVRLFGAA